MLRAVLDPGVLIAAAIKPRGVCSRILDHVPFGDLQIVASPGLLEELSDVLLRPRLRRYVTEAEAYAFVATVRQLSTMYEDVVLSEPLTQDPDDDYLVGLAQAARVNYLVSGDAHLTTLVDLDPLVCAPAQFLALLERTKSDRQ